MFTNNNCPRRSVRYFMIFLIFAYLILICGCGHPFPQSEEIYKAISPENNDICVYIGTTRWDMEKYKYFPDSTRVWIEQPDGSVFRLSLWSRFPSDWKITKCNPDGKEAEIPLILFFEKYVHDNDYKSVFNSWPSDWKK